MQGAEGKGSLGSLYSSSAPQYLGAAVGAGEARSCVCVFYGQTFPSDGAELCQIYLVLGFSKGGVGLVGISSYRE